MRPNETGIDSAIAVLAWQGPTLAGYALSIYGGWACVTRFQAGGMHEFCYRYDDALTWLRQSTNAEQYEAVTDQAALDERMASLPAGAGPVVMPSDLAAFAYDSSAAFMPFN